MNLLLTSEGSIVFFTNWAPYVDFMEKGFLYSVPKYMQHIFLKLFDSYMYKYIGVQTINVHSIV